MPKTDFVNNSSTISKEYLDSFRYLRFDGSGNPLEDDDGQFPPIRLEDLTKSVRDAIAALISGGTTTAELFQGTSPRVRIFGGGGGDGDFTGLTAELPYPIYQFNSLTIPAGSTVRIPNGAIRIKVKGDVSISGDLIATAIASRNLGDGSIAEGGLTYSPLASLIGSSGGSANPADPNLIHLADPGGRGGGSVIIEALGAITIAGSIQCDGSDGGRSQLPSNSLAGGSGGGSGGSIILYSHKSITVTGTLSANGGNGGQGLVGGAAGGGGGGGGWIVTQAPTLSVPVSSISVRGGNPGQSFGSGGFRGSYGGGFAGKGGETKRSGDVGLHWAIARAPGYEWL